MYTDKMHTDTQQWLNEGEDVQLKADSAEWSLAPQLRHHYFL